MYYLKKITSRIFSNLRIPSEREIRDLQLRQMKSAYEQENNSENGVTHAQPKHNQGLHRRNTNCGSEIEENSIGLLGIS